MQQSVLEHKKNLNVPAKKNMPPVIFGRETAMDDSAYEDEKSAAIDTSCGGPVINKTLHKCHNCKILFWTSNETSIQKYKIPPNQNSLSPLKKKQPSDASRR